MKVKEEIAKLRDTDTYSLILFALYKLRNVPEYRELSELAYILDKNSLLNFLEYFGGLTVKVPTIEELRMVVYTLLVYEYVKVDKLSIDEAILKLNQTEIKPFELKKSYIKLNELLEDYSIQI